MSTTKPPRCAALARQLGELPIGTATRIASVLLIEYAGPWGADVRERVLTECFGPSGPAWLDDLYRDFGLRALVIRRSGRVAESRQPSVFVGGCQPGRRWLERLTLERYSDLAELDLTAVASNGSGFGQPVPGPLLLVCAHGRKDACCAMLGRPVAAALATKHPEQTWQCSHFGGDRWAGNLLVVPHGFMYGQLDAGAATRVAMAAQAREVTLANLRGRVGIDPFAQVAEIAVRERTRLRGLDDVLAGPPRHDGEDQASVEVHAVGTVFHVRVRRSPLDIQGWSVCAGEAHPRRFEVLDIKSTIAV